ncbi:hypothetical protein [Sphingobacterium deserti]|uniref:Lipocalin-like domain-containing protein n=1 Tax=Sphingobacterium deserti TaxID=1229276 RepID=A0A0B8TBF2_9SPHI|nr:hypothetical protein [Sphingobacterium deserti]KGE16224.1 hypothetical protein DI53_0057 [Sphingobacterium deserti]
MTLFAKLISVCFFTIFATSTQDNRLYKRWKVIADKRIFLNLDGTSHGGFKDRVDSIKSDTVFIELFQDGKFKSVDGNGTFTVFGDSIALKLPDGESPFRYKIKDDSLYLSIDNTRDDYIRREVLHAVKI